MKQTRLIMGMPVIVEICNSQDQKIFDKIFNFFIQIDNKFSTYKDDSEISQINSGKVLISDASKDMKLILNLADKTNKQTDGFFNIYSDGKCDPSGIVKGWAIWQAGEILNRQRVTDYCLNVGGDIQLRGHNESGKDWLIGITDPFNQMKIVKKLALTNCGIATSGTYERGKHIYNPKTGVKVSDIVSLTVIGPNVYEADRFATAGFAMGKEALNLIGKIKGLEGYLIDLAGRVTYTQGFNKYFSQDAIN